MQFNYATWHRNDRYYLVIIPVDDADSSCALNYLVDNILTLGWVDNPVEWVWVTKTPQTIERIRNRKDFEEGGRALTILEYMQDIGQFEDDDEFYDEDDDEYCDWGD